MDGGDLLGSTGGHDVLQPVLGREVVVLAEELSGGDQGGIVFEAGQVLLGAQQAAA